jgi:hypothetical protein
LRVDVEDWLDADLPIVVATAHDGDPVDMHLRVVRAGAPEIAAGSADPSVGGENAGTGVSIGRLRSSNPGCDLAN